MVPVQTPEKSLIEEELPGLGKGLLFTAIQVYTPHLVTITDSIDEDLLDKIGLLANKRQDLFPEGINVSLVKYLDADKIYVRTYERDGIGLSLSCSSAMIASVCVMVQLGRLKEGRWISVYNRGGIIRARCAINQDHLTFQAELSGPAVFMYRGEATDQGDRVTVLQIFEQEQKQYDRFLETLRTECREKEYLKKKHLNCISTSTSSPRPLSYPWQLYNSSLCQEERQPWRERSRHAGARAEEGVKSSVLPSDTNSLKCLYMADTSFRVQPDTDISGCE